MPTWPSRYWGLRVPDTSDAGERVAIASLKMRAVAAGPDLAQGKPVTANNETFGAATGAVDGNAATVWETGGAGPAGGNWILIDFGSEVTIVEIEITAHPAGNAAPLEFYLMWSPDGSRDNAEDYSSFPIQGAWAAGETRTFSVTAPGTATSASAHQLGVIALVDQPAISAISSQLGVAAVSAAETSNGTYDVYAHQLGAYALVRPNGDRRELRAWRLKQDDHEWYGLQLGADGTLLYDKLTNQWCQWKSPGYTHWRAEDIVDWEGFNLAADTETGKIFEIDAEGRLDYGDTPITSKIVGYFTHRMREHKPCYMAELAVSEGQPPSGFEDGSVGISLRTSTDNGQSFVNHGEVAGEGVSEDMTARWYGLGLMKSPGMLFEITDTGYARRIDGLDIETVDG